MAQLGNDSAIRAAVPSSWGTATDGQTWAQHSTSATLSTSGTQLNMVGSHGGTIMILGSKTTKNLEALGRFSLANASDNAGFTIRYTDDWNWIAMDIQSPSGPLRMRGLHGTSSSNSSFQFATSAFTFTLSTLYWMRIRVIDTNYYMKVWQDGTAEPAAWTFQHTDSTITASGFFGVQGNPVAGGLSTFDSLVFFDAREADESNQSDSYTTSTSGEFDDARDALSPGMEILRTNTSSEIDDALDVVIPQEVLRATSIPITNESYSQYDLKIHKRQMCYVYDSSGNFLSTWPDAPLLAGFKESVNSATTPLVVELPRDFNDFDQPGLTGSRGTVNQGNVVKYYLYGPGLPTNGLLRFQGFIDKYEPAISESGLETVKVTITPMSAVLGDRGVTSAVTFGTANSSGTYVDIIDMINHFFSHADPLAAGGVSRMFPMTTDPTNPASSGNKTYYSFVNQTMQSIWDTFVLMLPANWFYRPNPDNTMTVNVTSVTPQHTFYVGQHINAPSYSADWTQQRNTIYVKGSTASGTSSLRQGSSISNPSIGVRIYEQNDSRVIDNNTAGLLSQGLLNLLDRAIVRTKIRVVDYRGDTQYGLGYDIETLKVGDSVQIIDPTPSIAAPTTLWDNATWDVDYWSSPVLTRSIQSSTIISLDYQFDYVDLELGDHQPNQDRKLFKIQRKFEDFTMI